MKFKNLILLFLIMTISITIFIACSDNDTPNSTVTGKDGENVPDETIDENLDAGGYLRDSLPNNLDFGGETVNIVIREAVAPTEFYVPEMTGDIVDDALYMRNRMVEERLNVEINFIEMPGEWADRDKMNGAIRASVMANDGAYDIAAVLSNQLSILTLEGLLSNLSELNYLDFDKPWWANGLLDELAVGGKVYFASGDASLGLINGMMCIFYNKSIAENHNVPNMYDIVTDGTWTIDKLIEYGQNIYSDLNGNGSVDDDDQFGFVMTDYNQVYGFIEAFELPVINKDDEGYPFEFSYGSEKVVNAVQKLVNMYKNIDGMKIQKETSLIHIFKAGRSLFASGEFKNTADYRDVDSFDYGVIPYPKWDESQTDYRSCVRATYSHFCIPVTAANKDMSAAVLEAFASESYRQVSPAYFEHALKIKYSRDNESAQMYDLVKSSVIFNFAISFTMSLNDPQNTFKGVVSDLNENWASTYASWEPTAQIKLDETITVLRELP